MQEEFFREIDLSAINKTSISGEPLIVEHWYDFDCEVFCKTIFYPFEETKEWDQDKHREFLLENNLLNGREEKYQDTGFGITKVTKNDTLMWSITAVMADG